MSLKIRSEVAPGDLGKAHALWYTGSYGGSALGSLLFGPLFDHMSVPAGFAIGAACLAVLGLAGVLAVAPAERAAARSA
mgnify:CR=1 FL=1